MAPLISALLAIATSLLLLAITIAKGEILKNAPGWLVPVLGVISGALYIAAIVLGFIHLKRERERKLPPPPVTVHQENKQEFNPQFNPTIQIGLPNVAVEAAEQDKARRETLVMEYMQ